MPSARFAMAGASAPLAAVPVDAPSASRSQRGRDLGRGRASPRPLGASADDRRASPRARCRSGSAPARPGGRGSRGPASRRGRRARTRTRCPCRRAARRAPLFSSSNSTAASPPVRSDWMTRPTELTVSIRPQKVPSRPRKTSRPGEIAHESRGSRRGAAAIESRSERVVADREAAPARAARRSAPPRREQHRRARRACSASRAADVVDPADLAEQPRRPGGGQHDADDEHAEDQPLRPGLARKAPTRSACRG